jgi:hypothetical protein
MHNHADAATQLKETAGRRAAEDGPLIGRLTELAQEYARYGCRRLFGRYDREARDPYMNYKRFRRQAC